MEAYGVKYIFTTKNFHLNQHWMTNLERWKLYQVSGVMLRLCSHLDSLGPLFLLVLLFFLCIFGLFSTFDHPWRWKLYRAVGGSAMLRLCSQFTTVSTWGTVSALFLVFFAFSPVFVFGILLMCFFLTPCIASN